MAGSAWTNQVQNQVIVGGANGRVLVYSGTPALGNLIASIAGANGTDPFGNAYLRGVVTYHEISVISFVALQEDATVLTWYTATSAAGPWGVGSTIQSALAAQIVMQNASGSMNVGTTDVPTNGGFSITNTTLSGFNGMLFSPSVGLVAQIGGVDETWHSLSLTGGVASASGNNVNGFFYRLTAWETVQMAYDITCTGNGTIGTLPAGYRPATTVNMGTGWYGSGPAAYTATFHPQIFVSSAGVVQTGGISAAGGITYGDVVEFPLGSL